MSGAVKGILRNGWEVSGEPGAIQSAGKDYEINLGQWSCGKCTDTLASDGTSIDGELTLDKKSYVKELKKLQVELSHMQDWVKDTGYRAIIVFEGRDAAGKGGVIKAMTQRVSPRVFRVVALPAPSDREKTQIYGQRFIQHFPSAGEIVIFDRSWYNRAGVEVVMGFCTPEQRDRFLKTTPAFERNLVDNGIKLVKYWMEVSPKEQKKRFESRIEESMKNWKLSPMDLESRRRWYPYSRARDLMFDATDTEDCPWTVVNNTDKHKGRLNCISHLLEQIPYEVDKPESLEMPPRDTEQAYDDQAPMKERTYVPDRY
jgi:polyphosphate kinase 2